MTTHGEPAKLRWPSYDVAYMDVFRDAVAGFISDDPVLGGIATVHDPHAGPIRNVRGEQPLDQPMQQLSVTMTLSKAALHQTDVDAHTAMIVNVAQQLLAEQTRAFLHNLSAISDAAGMTVTGTAAGAPTLEQFRELLEKMELEFDEEGKIRGQTLIVAPEHAEKAQELIKKVEADPDCQRIVLAKRAEWMAKRAERARRTLSR